MRKNAALSLTLMAALIAVIVFSDSEFDLSVDRAVAADAQDALSQAQQVAIIERRGIE
ncbi:hypothetical protein GCM10027082_24060 [Comamonas humi]